MNNVMLAFLVPMVCMTLVIVTNILKILKRMFVQIDRIEVKLLDIEGRIHI